MDRKTPATSGAKLLSAAACPDYSRVATARAKALQAMTTTPSLRRYLDEIIALFEERAVETAG